MKTAVLLLASLLSLAAFPGSRSDWDGAPLGIAIKQCVYDFKGVSVSFETDLPPPYVVAIFCPDEGGFFSRHYPLTYTTVYEKFAYFKGDYISKGHTFLQVFTSQITSETHSSGTDIYFFRNRVNPESYFATLVAHLDPNDPWEDDYDPWTDKYVSEHPYIIGDQTWASFTRSTDRYVTVHTEMSGFAKWVLTTNDYQTAIETKGWICSNEVTGAWNISVNETTNIWYDAYVTQDVWQVKRSSIHYAGAPTGEVWYSVNGLKTLNDARLDVKREYVRTYDPSRGVTDFDSQFTRQTGRTFTFGPFDTSAGTGYRIIYFDDKDEYAVQRAYSSMTNRSEEFVLKRPFKSLSAHDGMKIALDWQGRMRFFVETNAVPYRIYPEGL